MSSLDLNSPLTKNEIKIFSDLISQNKQIDSEPATISYAHGVTTASIIAPSLIPPSQSNSLFFNMEKMDFYSIEYVQQIFSIMARLNNNTVRDLNDKTFEPILYPEDRKDITAKHWARGFLDLVDLDPKWQWNSDIRDKMLEITLLAENVSHKALVPYTSEVIEAMRTTILKNLPHNLYYLLDYWRNRRDDDTTIFRHRKIARNDNCPCGSERKYKKCCMNNHNNTLH